MNTPTPSQTVILKFPLGSHVRLTEDRYIDFVSDNSYGKTAWAPQLVEDLRNHGFRVLVVSVEPGLNSAPDDTEPRIWYSEVHNPILRLEEWELELWAPPVTHREIRVVARELVAGDILDLGAQKITLGTPFQRGSKLGVCDETGAVVLRCHPDSEINILRSVQLIGY